MQPITLNTGSHIVRGIESSSRGRAVVLTHGNSGSAQLFAELVAKLEGRIARVIALDLPGHGESEHAEDPRARYSIPALASVLARALRLLGTDPVVLVGHSLGGHVMSAALAELAPIHGLMLISAPPLSVRNLASTFKPDPTAGALFRNRLAEVDVERFSRALIEPSPVESATLSRLKTSIARADGRFREALGMSIAAGELSDEARLVAELLAPVALVYGTADRFLDTTCFARCVLRNPWRTGRFPFVGSGHSPHLASPDAMAGLIGDFAEHCFATPPQPRTPSS
jgi:pimeloyl-ACP methyl ester carboxylesterase